MNKKIILATSALAIPSAAAYCGYGYGMMSGGYGFYGFFLFLLGAFIFSLIFWGTKKWLGCSYKNDKKVK